MNRYRTKLLNKYQQQLTDNKIKLKEIEELIPEFKNLGNYDTVNRERRLLIQSRRSLTDKISELDQLIEDMKNKKEDQTAVN